MQDNSQNNQPYSEQNNNTSDINRESINQDQQSGSFHTVRSKKPLILGILTVLLILLIGYASYYLLIKRPAQNEQKQVEIEKDTLSPSPTALPSSDKEDISPPEIHISGQDNGTVNTELTFNINVKAGSGVVVKTEVWISRLPDNNTPQKWTYKCPGEINDVFCRIKTVNPDNEEFTFSLAWIPEAEGKYYISVNAVNSAGGACYGNFINITPSLKQCKSNYPFMVTVK